MIPINYHHLYYFYVIAEEGSVTRAAEKMRIAQSSLSMQLAQFERGLEKKLFVREGRKMTLTEDGNHILAYAKAIFDLGGELIDSLGDRSLKGKIKIQIGVSSFIPKAVVNALLNFLFTQPNPPYVNVVEKTLEEMAADLMIHKLDMILNDLSYQAPAESGIQNHLLASIPVVLCANRNMAKKVRRIPQDLHHAPMIMPTAQSRIYHALHEYFLFHHVKPNVIAEVQDLELVRRLALAGKGIVPINQFSVKRAPSQERLVILGKANALNIHDSVYLIKKERKNPHPVVQKIISDFKIKV